MKTSKKSLKRILIALFGAMFCLFNSSIMAQAQGIYISAADFKTNKLSFGDEKLKKCKIKLHEFSYKHPVKVSCGDSVFSFSKDSIYGYKDKEGISHRFFNKNVFEILNPGEAILLYKILVCPKTKYDQAKYEYFFSKDVNSPIVALILNNLEANFETNKTFVELLDVHFKNNEELLMYDSIHKMYKINHLLELSITPVSKTN